MIPRQILTIVLFALGILIVLAGLWFFFLRSAPSDNPADTGGFFGTSPNQTVEVTPPTQTGDTEIPANTTQAVQQKIFRVVQGPVVGATIVQTSRPTTTVARYVQQNNGHVFDLALDSPGAVPKAISNTTIPGVVRVLWARQGEAALLQYLDGNTTKTVYLGFPPQQATTTQPVSIKFLPDGIRDIAVSPNGASVAYLLSTATGVRGYSAVADGTSSRELFTLPLSEVLITWPSQGTLLAHTKSAFGTPGISFSISASSGAAVPLLYAPGLTITADPSYSYLVYQTGTGSGPSTYVRHTATGQNSSLSFDPAPERCVWGQTAISTLYCAAPLTYVAANYLDLWHAGTATAAEALYTFTLPEGRGAILAVPGGDQGGADSTIDSMAVSPDDKYLLFVKRGDRSLWGVRIQ